MRERLTGHQKDLGGGFLVLATVCLIMDASRARPVWLLTTAVLIVGSQSSTATAIVLLVYGALGIVGGGGPYDLLYVAGERYWDALRGFARLIEQRETK